MTILWWVGNALLLLVGLAGLEPAMGTIDESPARVAEATARPVRARR